MLYSCPHMATVGVKRLNSLCIVYRVNMQARSLLAIFAVVHALSNHRLSRHSRYRYYCQPDNRCLLARL